MFSHNSQNVGSNRFANVSVNFPQQQPQQQQNQQNSHSQQFPSTSQPQQQLFFQQGGSIQSNGTQREPEWFNNPRKRTIPQTIIKRTTKRSSSVDPSSTDGNNSSEIGRSGFNSITFGSKKELGAFPSTENIKMVKKAEHNTSFMDSNEAPPTVSFYDWQREDDFGAINPLESQLNDSNSAFNTSQTNLSSVQSTSMKSSLQDSETNAFDKKDPKNWFSTNNCSNLEESTDSKDTTAAHESAVIVFGYPESISNLIITHFSKFGRILEDFEVLRSTSGINTSTLRLRGNKSENFKQQRKYPIFTGDGWVKLTFDGSAAAIRALEENGRVFGGSLIGCVPYNKKAVEQLASCHIEKNDDIGEMNLPSSQIPLGGPNSLDSTSTKNSIEGFLGTKDADSKSIISDTTPVRSLGSVTNNVLPNTNRYTSRKLDIKDGKSLFVHTSSTNNHNFLQSLEAKMRQQEENNKKQAGVLHKVNNWLFGWNDL